MLPDAIATCRMALYAGLAVSAVKPFSPARSKLRTHVVSVVPVSQTRVSCALVEHTKRVTKTKSSGKPPRIAYGEATIEGCWDWAVSCVV